MAASGTLPQPDFPRKSPIGRRGVLTLTGFGIKIRMQAGHLEIEDGIGPERRTIKLARIGHKLKRLVCISEDGFATLAALKWISDVGASFVMLNRNGKVLFATGPNAPSDVRLRRAQSPEEFNAPAIIDFEKPIFGKSSWAVNKTNMKMLIKLYGDDETKLVGKKIKLEVIKVRNPQTGEFVPSLAVTKP